MSSNIEKSISSHLMLEIYRQIFSTELYSRTKTQYVIRIYKKADNYIRALTVVKTSRSALSARGSAKGSKDSSKRNLNFMAV